MFLQQIERGRIGRELRGPPQRAALDKAHQRLVFIGGYYLIDVPDQVAVAMDQAAQRALVDEEREADAVGGEAELALHSIGDILGAERLSQRQADALRLARPNLERPNHRTRRGDR